MPTTTLRTAGQAVRGAMGARPASAAGALTFARGKATLPDLSYDYGALEPHISGKIMEIHHKGHHQTYVTNLNNLVKGTDNEKKDLVEIIKSASGPLFNNAAQVWNHTFYWNSLAPNAGGEPDGAVKDAIIAAFGSFDTFKQEFSKKATGHFASGWAWLVLNKETGKVEITDTHDADTVVKNDKLVPLLTCDVWEHAYYIDYRNARAKYLDAWWNIVNWKFANENLAKSK
jgi:Fe-Mn family superoxide dismutase